MATSKRIMLYLVISAFLPLRTPKFPAPGYPCCRVEVKMPRARRIYFIGRFIPEDEEIFETGGEINYELRIMNEGTVRDGGVSGYMAIANSERAPSDRQAEVAKLFQELDLFGKGECTQPLARGAFAFQNFAHPITHGLSQPDGSGLPRNFTPNCSHFSISPCRSRMGSSLLESRTPASINCRMRAKSLARAVLSAMATRCSALITQVRTPSKSVSTACCSPSSSSASAGGRNCTGHSSITRYSFSALYPREVR